MENSYKIVPINKINNLSVVILAAGISERMEGFYKPLLPFNNGCNFLEQIVKIYTQFKVNEIIIVVNKTVYSKLDLILYKKHNIHIEVNPYPEKGRFYSIILGVSKVLHSDYCFLQNVDNPFVTNELLSTLVKNKTDLGYAVPYFNNEGGHPIIISKAIIRYLQNEKNYFLNLKNILRTFKKVKVQVDDKNILVNINSITDYKNYFELTNVNY